MATITKTAATLVSSQSNAAGATTTGTGRNISTTFGGLVQGRITNGATGPTIPCDMVVEVSTDNTNWYQFSRQTSLTGNSVATDLEVEVPYYVMYVRVRFTGNTGQAVTVEAYLHEATSIA